MDKLFTGWNFVFIYLDDILIASKSFSEHIAHITQVLQRLQEAGLKVKPSKCIFGEKQVDYLGSRHAVVCQWPRKPRGAQVCYVRESPLAPFQPIVA